ncbi:MAG: YfhO family protein [Planctomycetes bacterium]|nr:YfhO family protein [Planctomycetota bacterium]
MKVVDARPSAGETRLRELVLAAGLVCVLLVAFFEKPLANYATHHYTSADVTQVSALTRVEGRHVPHNQELSDPVVEMLPWLLHDRAELAEGRFPLWNAANGCGQPLFANAQSAVLSPFSLPYYVLPLRAALLVVPAAKLLLAALFTWLFLRRIGLGFWPALFGATSFAWCGHNVTLLAYPHTAAVLVLPAGLYFAELALVRLWERRPGRALALLGLTATLASGVFAGQPEPFFFGAVGVGLWCAYRLLEFARVHGGADRWRRALASAAWLGGSAGIAAGLAAVQLFPFFEYLRASTLGRLRDVPQTPLLGGTWPLLFFPNLLGNPSKIAAGWPEGPRPSFEHVHAVTTSGFVIFLALVSIAWIRRSRAHAFFMLIVTWWVLYAYNVFGFAHALGELVPGLGIAPLNRSQALGVFAACACAAFAVERIAALEGRARIAGSVAVLALAALVAWLASNAAHDRLERYLARRALSDEFVQYARAHIRAMTLLFAVGAAVVATKPWLRARALGWTAGPVLVLVAFAPWGWMLRNYNPTVPDRLVFPATAALDRLRLLARDERVLVFGEDGLPPETNLVYGVEQPTGYDALGVDAYRELWDAHFGEGGNWMVPRRATLAGLSMLGIRTLLTRGSWLPVETTFAGCEPNAPQRFRISPVAPGLEVAQTFTAGADELQGVRVELATDGRANRCTLWLALEDVERGRIVELQSVDASSLRADERERCELVFRFEPVRDSKGRRFRFTLSSPDATASQCVIALGRRDFAMAEHWGLAERPDGPLAEYTPGELRVGGERVQGGLVLDLSYRRELFRRVTELDGFTLWKYEQGAGPFTFATSAHFVRDGAESLANTHAVGFDPRREVVLFADAAHPAGAWPVPPNDETSPEAQIHVAERTSTRTRLEVRSATHGWLVAAETHYPGWTARVNGVERPLLRANHAFQAVELPAGSSEVELAYEPASFRNGLWISATSLLALLAGFVVLRRAERRALGP